MNTFTQQSRALREKFTSDPHRPKVHFLPPANWMNDPNGLIQWNGQYHLFYQYNPNGAFWGTMHWGHAVSSDLVHWADLPVALAPTPGGPDAEGIFSGCAVDNDGTPTIIYTGVTGSHHEIQVQCVASSADNLLTWEKYAGNPVITPPPGIEITGFRDPFVWREEDSWYVVIGSGIKDVGGTVFLYRSSDLIHWEYLNPLLVGEPEKNGTMWECPNFFPLGDKHVLMISTIPMHDVHYFVGTFANHRFTPEFEGKIDQHGMLYAPLTLLDDGGRRLMWGWISEERSIDAQKAAGWAGVQAIPRVLSLLPDGTVGVEPVPEFQALRGQHHHLISGDFGALKDICGDLLEIVVQFEAPASGRCGLTVRRSDDGTEKTDIYYDPQRHCIAVDRRASTTSPDAARDLKETRFQLGEGEVLKLHIFLDRSVVEIFANGRIGVTSRIYPSRSDSLGIGLLADNATEPVAIDIWELKSSGS